MRGGNNQGPSPGEAPIIFLTIAGMFACVSYTGWTFFKPTIVAVVLNVHHYLMAPAHLFTDAYLILDRQILAKNPDDPTIELGSLWRLAHDVGLFWRWPAAALILFLVTLVALRVRGSYARDMNLRDLMNEQAKQFPFITPYLTRHLRLVAPAPGAPRPADPALHAQEWADRFAMSEDYEFCPILARTALIQQLGPLWTGHAGASPQVKIMFAIFALHAARRKEDAMDLLNEFAVAVPPGDKEGPEGPLTPLPVPLNVVKSAEEWLRDPEVAFPCDKIAAGHAYCNTAMMSVLSYARERSGGFNPGLFTFLQLMDRGLYFALDSLGGITPGQSWHRSAAQATFVEALGVREHWATERDADQALAVPCVDRAVKAIEANIR